MTGDRGLAGAFNTQIIREGLRLKRELECDGAEVGFSVVGRRGDSALTFRRRSSPEPTSASPTARRSPTRARSASDLIAAYVDEELDRVELVYNRYVSPLTQYVRRQTLLPLQQAEVFGERRRASAAEPEERELAEAHRGRSWIYEPEPEELLAQLFPEYVEHLGLPGAARVGRIRARRADDGDAQRRRERGDDDRAT